MKYLSTILLLLLMATSLYSQVEKEYYDNGNLKKRVLGMLMEMQQAIGNST